MISVRDDPYGGVYGIGFSEISRLATCEVGSKLLQLVARHEESKMHYTHWQIGFW